MDNFVKYVCKGTALFIFNMIMIFIIFGESVYNNEILKLTIVDEVIFRCVILGITVFLMEKAFGDLKKTEKNRNLSMKERVFIGIKSGIVLLIATVLPFLIKSDAFVITYVVTFLIMALIEMVRDFMNKMVLEKIINKKIKELNRE